VRTLIAALVALCSLTAPAAFAQTPFPKKIPLPDAFAPEGIEIGAGTTFYVGSTQTGAIYSGDVRTGVGRILIPGGAPGTRAATGIEYDRGRLWVAGAGGGTGRVYDVKTGKLVREYHLSPSSGTFINDLVVTKTAAYFTDSERPVILRVAIGKNGAPGALTTIRLKGDYHHIDGQLNLNGIVASGNGKSLIAVSTAARKLYLINPATGVAKTIPTGTYDLVNGDGLLLDGLLLYVVQNRSNLIAILRLSNDLKTATYITAINDPDLDVPTTIDRVGNRVYAVNARFGTATPSDQHYDIVKAGDG
jgi:outer membrane protein assembly factor BamB